MADHRGSRGYPPTESPGGSSYPPPPEDENDRRPQYPPVSGPPPYPTSLPPMTSYPPTAPPPPGPAYPPSTHYSYPDHRYSQDQRAWPREPPANPNGYPPPEPPYPPPPPVSSDRRAYDDRSRQYEDPRQYDERSRQYDRSAYPPDPYYGSQPGPVPYSYAGYPPPPHHGYQYPPTPQAPPPQPQAAPRQRTSIACKYCRKRKIRCSGVNSTMQGGKCSNCLKLKIDCVFQPVSSNNTTAFVPVSAFGPGSLPPGTPLYGAFGQPLPPAPGQPQHPYSVAPSEYPAPAHSPTTSQYPPLDDRDRDMARRRTRPPEDGHGLRLPPPNFPKDDDPRRRSPSSIHSNGTPPMAHHPYPPTGYDQGPADAPRQTSPPRPPPSSQPPSNPMKLNNLIDSPDKSREYDRNMVGKLNRRP